MSAPKSPYRQLQAQAKARGIPANQSAGILEELLAEEEAGGEGFSGSVAGSNEPSNVRSPAEASSTLHLSHGAARSHVCKPRAWADGLPVLQPPQKPRPAI